MLSNIPDIGFCTKCRQYATIRDELPPSLCEHCGEMTFKRLDSITQAEPISIPVAALMSRYESPHLTPDTYSSVISDHFVYIPVPESAIPFGRYVSTEVPTYLEGCFDTAYINDFEHDQAIEESILDAPSPEIKPADPIILASMSRFKYTPDNKTPTSCVICADEFELDSDLVMTNCCGAVTHYVCMENSLCVMSSCPFCRRGRRDSNG